MDEAIQKLQEGGIGILPTEKMYAIVADAMDQEAVEKIYAVRGRNLLKPMVVLVGSYDDIFNFNPDLSPETKAVLERIWPAHVSIVLPVPGSEFEYLSRGTQTIAMRIPEDEDLRALLVQTGPLVAPSANTEGGKPAETLEEARAYFPELDFHADGGTMPNNPSTLIALENTDGKIRAKVLRQGEWKVPDFLL